MEGKRERERERSLNAEEGRRVEKEKKARFAFCMRAHLIGEGLRSDMSFVGLFIVLHTYTALSHARNTARSLVSCHCSLYNMHNLDGVARNP